MSYVTDGKQAYGTYHMATKNRVSAVFFMQTSIDCEHKVQTNTGNRNRRDGEKYNTATRKDGNHGNIPYIRQSSRHISAKLSNSVYMSGGVRPNSHLKRCLHYLAIFRTLMLLHVTNVGAGNRFMYPFGTDACIYCH